MIANFFNKTKPVNILNLVVLLFVYYVVTTFFISDIELSTSFILKSLGYFFCYVILLLTVNFIVSKNNLTEDNLYTLLLLTLLIGTFSQVMFANRIIFANIILLFSYRKIYSIKSGLNTNKKLFDAGFWVGVATLIYSGSILYVVLIYLAIIIYQKVTVKNLFIPVIGLVTPLILYFTYHFYFDSVSVFLEVFNFKNNFNYFNYNQLKILIPITFLSAIVLWSIVVVIPKIIMESNNLKLSWNVLINHLLISLVIVLLAPIKDGSEFLFIMFPSAIIITNFLQKSQSSNFKNLILYLFLIISIGVYFL